MASTNINMLKKTSNNKYSDECYTPKEAVIPLLKYLKKTDTHYDCTSNISSNIVDVMKAENFKCICSNGKSFLDDDIPTKVDVIITNPPYSIKDKFIKRCYELKKPFALLLPVSALQGKYRGELFEKYGIELLVLNKRIDFTGKKSPHFGVAWFCYNILPKKIIFHKTLGGVV